MSTHTHWKVVEEFDNESNESLGLYVKDGDEIIASLPGLGLHNFDPARMIAAAPVLLEALKDARNTLAKALQTTAADWFPDAESINEHLYIKRIDVAIAKTYGAV